jgi:serine/threonine protein kinase
LPPEAFEGVKPSPAFDLWAAAMVLYEAIAGRHPLRGAGDRGPGKSKVPELRSVRRDCPSDLSDLLTRALSLVPAQRPSTAKGFRVDLSHYG